MADLFCRVCKALFRRHPSPAAPCSSKPHGVIHLKQTMEGVMVGPLEWAGHGGEWAPQGQKQSGELGWKRTNEFFRCLPALDWWHHLTVLSITLLPPLPWPIFSPSPLSFPPTFTADRKKKHGEKTVYFSTGLLIYLDWA